MSSAAPIKVGFVGLSASGWAADILGPSLLEPSVRPKYDLVAISTTAPESAQASADKYAEKVATLSKLAVKVSVHKQVILPVIEAGKNFFLEWPAGVSLKETQEIADAAKAKGLRTLIGLQGRHSRTLSKVKELLAAGAIGRVHSTHIVAHLGRELVAWPPVVLERLVFLSKKDGGGTRLDIPIGHQLDTLTYLLGDFTSLVAIDSKQYPTGAFVDDTFKPTGKTFPSEIPDHFAISGILSSGVIANLFYRGGNASGPETGRRQYLWEIDGEEGSIRLESDHIQGAAPSIIEPKLFLNGKEVAVEGAEKAGALDSAATAWKEFAHGEGNYATIEDALKNKKLLNAIETSAREGKRVTL
ncbi:hypothetical protein NLJ89_g9068 [Agrocybe chaxingu]|uniref:Gal80p-like C-terminal domain-containing protein n=1 Tax=Agrocybe chaxingu TaxID=84603 RepID=A0A9W8MTH3_9AGAR|nr:hypothetical protein NLJ89_g9068 [Agrocybe chaxingu]